MRHLKFAMLAIAAITLVQSCKKDDVVAPVAPKVTTGLYILSEGINQAKTTLTYYNLATNTPTTDFYAITNGSGLGDTGNDMIVYGSKMYIVVHISSVVQVVDAATVKSIQRIEFKTGTGAPRQPRYAVGYKNKVLVSSYDGTVAVIDTTSLTVEKFITVGKNPEQMAISGDKLVVSNSGGLSYPRVDSTVSVIDLNSFTEIRKVTVGANPGSVVADDAGNVYVSCRGILNSTYTMDSIKPKLVKMSVASYAITKSADTTVGKMKFYNGAIYATGGYGLSKVRVLNTIDFGQKSPSFVTDGTAITTPYGIDIDAETGDVYVTDAKDYVSSGQVFCFDKDGKRKYSFSVTPGVNPNTVVVIKR
jgi:YVTN family beta-propeller protein